MKISALTIHDEAACRNMMGALFMRISESLMSVRFLPDFSLADGWNADVE